jgi:hypothetical protein
MGRMVGKSRIHSTWSSDGGTLTFTRDDASVGGEAWGANGDGMDFRFNGETSSAYTKWIASSDTLYIASSAKFVSDGTYTVNGVVSFTGSTIALGNASTDKIGFFNQTPAVQPAFMATSAIASALAIYCVEALRTLGLVSATG